jgi:hypothetical protein
MSFVTYFKDTLRNVVTGLGQQGIDPSRSTQFILELLSRDVLENMYRGDWLARRICDQPADDMTREWRSWQANQQQIEALTTIEKSMDLQRKVKNWIIKARLYGGSALVIGVDDGNPPDTPLDLEKCGKGCLKYVVVLHRYELNAGPRIYNVNDPYYTRAAYYTVATPMFGFAGEGGVTSPTRPGEVERVPGAVRNWMGNVLPFKGSTKNYPVTTPTNIGLEQIHPSRVLELPGNELPDWRLAPLGGGWGDSVLQTVVDMVNSFTTTYQSISAMVADGKLDVVKIPDMTTNLTEQKYKDRLIERFALSAQTKSVISALLLDKEEDWNRVNTSFSGLDMILHEFLTLVSGAAGMPVSILFGQAHGRGLQGGSTRGGTDDVRSYYDGLATEQKNEIAPRMGMLDQVLMRSALGKPDPNIHYEWNPLWQLSDDDKAKIALGKAQATQIYATIGIINEDALREGVVNQLVEDGTYPGLDDAIEEYGSEPEEPDDTGGYGGPGGGGKPGGGEPDSEDLGFGGKMGDEEAGHPFHGNQYVSGQSGGGKQVEGGQHARASRVFLSSPRARSIIRTAIKETISAGEHITKHEAEIGVTSAVLAALTALGAPTIPAAIAASVAAYAVHRIAHRLGINADGAHKLLQKSVRGLRNMAAHFERIGAVHAYPQLGFGDADENSVQRSLRLLDDVLSRYTLDQLNQFLRGLHDEEAGHPFRGNQYTTGQSGGGKDETPGRHAGEEGSHPGHGYSKDAKIDENGVIQTGDVRDAARALWQGRKVELNQIKEVSTLIEELGKMAAKMEATGYHPIDPKTGKEKVFDLCKVSVPGTNLFCEESHGIPRRQMPQMSDQQTRDFLPYLENKGYKVTTEKEYAANLKATQVELDGAKVARTMAAIRKDPSIGDRPIVISRDNYILDGHHTWAAKIGIDAADGKLRTDKQMNVMRAAIGTIHMLHQANLFTGKKGRKAVGAKDYDPNQPRAASAPGHSGGEFAAYGRALSGEVRPSSSTLTGSFGGGIESIARGVGAGEEQVGAETGGMTEPAGGRKASPGVPDSLVQAIEDHVIGMAGEGSRHGAVDLSKWIMRAHRKDVLDIIDKSTDKWPIKLLHKGDPNVGMPTVWLLSWSKNDNTSIHDHLESEVGVSVARGKVGNRVYSTGEGYLDKSKSKGGLDSKTGEQILKLNQTLSIKAPYIHEMFGTSEPGAKRDVTVHAYFPPLKQMHYFKKDTKGRLHYAGDWDEDRNPEDVMIADAMRLMRRFGFHGCPCCAPRLIDFNPYHEPAGSSEGGRFTSGQGAEGLKKKTEQIESFVSPNTGNLTFEQAVERLNSERHKQVVAAVADIEKRLGIKAQNASAIGAWRDGAENSIVIHAPSADPQLSRAAAAMEGYIANQKQVLFFQHGDHDQVMAEFEASDKIDHLHQQLLDGGVAFHTIEPEAGDRYKVHVFAGDQDTVAATKKVADHYGAQVTANWGHGDFLGTTSEQGSDAEQRADARRQYEKIIADVAATPGMESVAKTWSDVRHRWGQITDAIIGWLALLSLFDEGHGHPFRGNQYTTGESGGEAPWTFAGGPHGEQWQKVADDTLRQWREEHPKVEEQTVALRRDLDQAMAAAANYTNMKDWYDDHKAVATRIFGEDEPLFERFLAAASLNSAGQDNVNRALNAYVHYKLGGSFDPENYSGVMKLEMNKYNEIVRGEQLGGEKLSAFDNALRGNWNRVAADRHMKRLFFENPHTKGGSWQNDVTRALVQAMAKKMDWKPAQLQAALWAVAKARSPKGLPSIIFTYRQYLEKQEARLRSIMHTVRAIGGKRKPTIPALTDAAELFDISLGDKLADAYRDARLLVELADVVRHHSSHFRDEEQGHPFRGNQYTGGIGGGERAEEEDTTPKSWDDLSSKQQGRIESAWREDAYQKEIEYQQEEWRRSGEARHDAERETVDQWNGDSDDRTGWSDDALDEALSGWKEEHGSDIPYTAEQLHQAIELRKEYDEDMEVKFDDTRLQEPSDLGYGKGQLALPGIEHADPSGHLTKEMREHLTDVIKEKFDDRATDAENYVEPPDFSESANETVDQIWHEMDDKEKFEWGRKNTGVIESERPGRQPPPWARMPQEKPFPTPEFYDHVRDLAKKVADPRLLNQIRYNTQSTFEVTSGGGLVTPFGETRRDTGQIKLFVRNLQGMSDKQIEGIIKHESMHNKFNDVAKAFGTERKELQNALGEEKYSEAEKKGEFTQEYTARFPVATQMMKYETGEAKEKLINEIGDHPVSPYSTMYWNAASRRPSGDAIFVAIHETLGEIARREHEEGKLPEGIPTWTAFYKTVNSLWEKRHERT